MTKHAEELAKLGWQYFECPACGSEGARAFPKPEQEPVLQDIEQYRLQMAGISTAAIGYWKEGDGIHPDYDTLALRDVAKLYEKYDELYKAQDVSHGIIAGALFDFMGWLTSRPKRIMLSSADDASPAVDAIKDFAKMRGLSLDDARVQDWQEALAEQPAQDDPDLQDKDPELVEQPAQHEPFTHYRHYDNGLQDWADEKTIPLYTSPPAQRTWVGLTDEEIGEVAVKSQNGISPHDDTLRFARAIEAKLKEKNA